MTGEAPKTWAPAPEQGRPDQRPGLPRYDEPLHHFPPREGLRPGTAAGDPQTPF